LKNEKLRKTGNKKTDKQKISEQKFKKRPSRQEFLFSLPANKTSPLFSPKAI